ncbi:hypothetical protein SAMD00019534_108910 [Acytostelium subglobosum LB1]|uniref:hypothetical protein n=1 Tax=Acytostelium subglobosum LB1 TaxID=1410327 RepID=UPI000644DC5F|nr:hypothetical protein SAMD00019534_108910 [Acytostelium subglobosum LB1]GAM27715.1 hypothetical protein SAMD00019534_108910 [Acytostelium subglobosum LB1]|eukprot:XP_012749374.1 hypothetical protein SAMD00019534_108910 [Acytostelium subglobosum LB1]
MSDIYVIRNLPHNLEEQKLHELIYKTFTQEAVQIVEYNQGYPGTKENTPTRCYVKIAKQSVDAFIDHIDGRPFVNNRGVEERSTLEKAIFNIPSSQRAVNNKHNNKVETSKTYLSFLQQLNAPEPAPPSLEALRESIEKASRQDEQRSLIIEELTKKKEAKKEAKKSTKHEKKRK